MTAAQPPLQQPRFLAGIGVSLAVHLLLVGLWQLSRPAAAPDDGVPLRTPFLRLLPAPAPEQSGATTPLPSRRAPVETPSRRQAGRPAQQAVSPVDSPEAVAARAEPAATTDTPAAPPSGASLLERARLAAGGIDRTPRVENPRRGIHAPVDTPMKKLERGIARAAELAPKVEAIVDPGGYGRRRYRVVGAAGTYCITYESNHAPDGIDSMQRGIQPKKTTCDEDEQPPTFQK
ncbi:MAG: hypothetical protein V7631_4034 [Massilia sp.]|jgi:hypothetical protein